MSSGRIGRSTQYLPADFGVVTIRPEVRIRAERIIIVLLGSLVFGIKAVAVHSAGLGPTAPIDLANAAGASNSVVLEDDFAGDDGVITGHDFYAPAPFPSNGTSQPTNPSSLWEGDTGYFYRQDQWGYSGRPSDWKYSTSPH